MSWKGEPGDPGVMQKVDCMNEENSNTRIRITLYFKGVKALRNLDDFIEKIVVPIQKKYPYAEIHIEVSA